MAKILFFGRLADIAGGRTREWPLGEETRTIGELVSAISNEDAALGAALNQSSVRFVLNEMTAAREACVNDEDEVAFLPPVSGG